MDRENVISNLEQQIRWIEEIECHQFPGWLNVTNAMRDALALLKEQDADAGIMQRFRKYTNEYELYERIRKLGSSAISW